MSHDIDPQKLRAPRLPLDLAGPEPVAKSPQTPAVEGEAPMRSDRISIVPRASLIPRPARRRPSNRRQARKAVARDRAVATTRPSIVPSRRPPAIDPLRASQLLAEFTPTVRQIVGGFQRKLPRNVLREDLMGAGMSGLWDAIRRHGGEPGESFEWYVRVRIRGAILDELRAQDWLPRRARAAAAEANEAGDATFTPPSVVRFDDVSEWDQARCLASCEESNSEAAVHAKFTREALAHAVERLPERERIIVAAHYFQGVKFKDLGAQLGVSEPRISQLHSRAMQRLRVLMGEAA